MVGKEHQVQIGRKCISINDEDWERGWVSEKVLSSYQDKSTGKIKVFDSCHHHHCYDDPHHFSFVSCQVDVCPKWLVLKSFNYFLSLHLARINLITIVITSSPPPLLSGMIWWWGILSISSSSILVLAKLYIASLVLNRKPQSALQPHLYRSFDTVITKISTDIFNITSKLPWQWQW